MSKEWYVLHTYSGYERKVKMSLEEQFDHSDQKDKLGENRHPHRRSGGGAKRQKKDFIEEVFPGYILINVEMTQDIWYRIKTRPR